MRIVVASSVIANCMCGDRDKSGSSSAVNITGLSSYNLPKGKHGVAEGSGRGSGLQRKLPLQGNACFGDYCNLLTPLAITLDDTDEYLQTVNMMKVRLTDCSKKSMPGLAI
jgi:hypothetical protein